MTRPTSSTKTSSRSRRTDLATADKFAPLDAAAVIKVVHANLAATAAHPSRDQLIAEAAYHRAESRRFEPGHDLEDWLVAEAEVDSRLQGEGRAY